MNNLTIDNTYSFSVPTITIPTGLDTKTRQKISKMKTENTKLQQELNKWVPIINEKIRTFWFVHFKQHGSVPICQILPFFTNDRKHTAGRGGSQVYLSLWYLRNAKTTEIDETIQHELIHVWQHRTFSRDNNGNGHGFNFFNKAKEIGLLAFNEDQTAAKSLKLTQYHYVTLDKKTKPNYYTSRDTSGIKEKFTTKNPLAKNKKTQLAVNLKNKLNTISFKNKQSGELNISNIKLPEIYKPVILEVFGHLLSEKIKTHAKKYDIDDSEVEMRYNLDYDKKIISFRIISPNLLIKESTIIEKNNQIFKTKILSRKYTKKWLQNLSMNKIKDILSMLSINNRTKLYKSKELSIEAIMLNKHTYNNICSKNKE